MQTWYSAEEYALSVRDARLAEAARERLLREARRGYGPRPAFAFWSPRRALAAIAARRWLAAGWTGVRLIRLGEALQAMASPPELCGCETAPAPTPWNRCVAYAGRRTTSSPGEVAIFSTGISCALR